MILLLSQLLLSLLVATTPLAAQETLVFKERLKQAEAGDYIVAAIDTNYTALIVRDKQGETITIEEITAPGARLPRGQNHWRGWRHWIESGSPGYTSRLLFSIDCRSGQLVNTQPARGNHEFFCRLLNLRMSKVRTRERKRVGPSPGLRRIWAPKMVYEGKQVADVPFDAWQARWPVDSSPLSGKKIVAYTPAADYPSHFPYWLEVFGMVGKAKVRIVDSGRNLLPQVVCNDPPGGDHTQLVFLLQGNCS